MWAADPDPGVLRMKELKILGKRVTWANLFAVNDRESMSVAMEKLVPYMTDQTTTVGVDGLRPGMRYRYVFEQGRKRSPIGTFETAPTRAANATVRFGPSGDADATPGPDGQPAFKNLDRTAFVL